VFVGTSVKPEQHHDSRTPYGAFTNLNISIPSMGPFIGGAVVERSAAREAAEPKPNEKPIRRMKI